MRATIFKQYSGPWASLPFPKGNTVKGCGCGLCSVTHVIIEQDKYKNYTPSDVQPFMIRYAVKNAGLQHAGIPESLKHYGMENVKEFGRAATMKQIFEECGKGGRLGVILFYKQNSKGNTISATGPDGTTWTGGGHFIAFTGYKVENGKHYFYMKDSGGRDHDGWYCYEKSMAGCVWKVWTCTLPGEKATEPVKEEGPEKVIDISYVQKSVDFAKVKAAGISGAIIRCGYRGYGDGKLKIDSMFKSHVAGAAKAGLKLGVYFFTEAVNAAEGKEEAEYTLKLIKEAGITLSYPVAVDTEHINAKNPTPRANNLSKAKRTEAIKAFCEAIKAAGYEPMIYASTDWLNNKLDMSKLPYKVWVAQYNDKVTYKGEYVMWQYTSTGKISGISGNVDVSNVYSINSPAKTETAAKTEILTVDGRFGKQSITRAQQVFDTPADGFISGQTTRKHCPGIVSGCILLGGHGSAFVKALQKEVGAEADGFLGPVTIKALQAFLNIKQDGVWGAETSKAFQRWLNDQEV